MANGVASNKHPLNKPFYFYKTPHTSQNKHSSTQKETPLLARGVFSIWSGLIPVMLTSGCVVQDLLSLYCTVKEIAKTKSYLS